MQYVSFKVIIANNIQNTNLMQLIIIHNQIVIKDNGGKILKVDNKKMCKINVKKIIVSKKILIIIVM